MTFLLSMELFVGHKPPHRRFNAWMNLTLKACHEADIDLAIEKLTEQIDTFVDKYCMTTGYMRHCVSAGTQEETMEILEWLMLDNRRSYLQNKKVAANESL